MILNEKQQNIIQAKESKIVVLAAAASGKTTVLVERLKYLLNQGIDPTSIVAITFTNAAAENIRERVGLMGTGAFIGTVHSYANYLLLCKSIDTSSLLEKEKFDTLFYLIKAHPECIKPVEHLLLDEAQDSTELQFEFLLQMIKPKNYFFVGDHKQSIYRWSGADPDFLINLMKSEGVTTYPLNQNYRNAQSILTYAKSIIRINGIDYLDKSICMRDAYGSVNTQMKYSPQTVARFFKTQINNYKDWFLLCRWNSDLNTLADTLEDYNIPYDTFRRAELTNNELREYMQRDSIKLLTIHASKGLESPNVLVVSTPPKDQEDYCIHYVAATRAKDMLIWANKSFNRKKKDNPFDRIATNSWE